MTTVQSTTTQELVRLSDELKANIDQYLTRPTSKDHRPDHARIGDEVMWGGVWQGPDLDLRLRSIATITAQVVNGWDFGIIHQVRVGLTLGITPQAIKAMLTELVFWVGIPATVFALLQVQKVIDERDEWKAQDKPLDGEWLATVEEKMQRGRQTRRDAWGAEADEELANTLTQRMVPHAAQLVDAYLYGEIQARSPLTPQERSVAILAALMSRGHMRQLRRHIGYALNAGMTERQICEVFAQAGWYRGWPYVEDALTEAEVVFAERNT